MWGLLSLAPKLLEKWFPLQGERAHSLFKNPISIQIKSISNPIHFCSSFFLCHQLCGSHHLVQSCSSFFIRLHGSPELFGSYHLLQPFFSFFVSLHGQTEPFGSSSVTMAKLRCLLVTTFSSLIFHSNSFSTSHFNLLFEWPGAVSQDLLFLTTFSLVLFF